MYVADAEANIIRDVELPPANHVRTLAGGDLFDFGDHDGFGDDVRLQHPLGLCEERRRKPCHLPARQERAILRVFGKRHAAIGCGAENVLPPSFETVT